MLKDLLVSRTTVLEYWLLQKGLETLADMIENNLPIEGLEPHQMREAESKIDELLNR